MIGKTTKILLIATNLCLFNIDLAVARCLKCTSIDNNRELLISSELAAKQNRATNQDSSDRNQISSRPNFWWVREQFDPFGGRLVESWTSHSQLKEISLVVNLHLWTLMDYLGRYSFVNQFGSVARKYGYNLNIISNNKQQLATYKYNSINNPPKWEINLERLGKDSLRISPSDLPK